MCRLPHRELRVLLFPRMLTFLSLGFRLSRSLSVDLREHPMQTGAWLVTLGLLTSSYHPSFRTESRRGKDGAVRTVLALQAGSRKRLWVWSPGPMLRPTKPGFGCIPVTLALGMGKQEELQGSLGSHFSQTGTLQVQWETLWQEVKWRTVKENS